MCVSECVTYPLSVNVRNDSNEEHVVIAIESGKSAPTKNAKKLDYLTNCGLGNYSESNVPLGFNTQIFKFKDLKKNYKFCNRKDLKEHPSLYFYREGKKKYKLKNLSLPIKYRTNLKIRLTIDTYEDLRLARLVFNNLTKNKGINFGLEDVINFFKKNKPLLKINENTHQKKVRLKI